MTRRAAALAALGLAAYLLFLVATVPVSFIAARAAAATQGALRLTDTAGPWWRGEARVRWSPPGGVPLDIERVTWTLLPTRLFAGRIAFDVRAASPGFGAELEAARAIGGWQARGLQARGDASALAAFMPLLSTFRPSGPVTFTAPRLDWDGERLRGAAQAEWRGAGLALSEVRPLGSFKASLEAADGPAKITLATIDGPLRLNGQGTLTSPGAFTFTGEARADAAQAAALEPLLAAMGPRRPDGAYSLDWRSR